VQLDLRGIAWVIVGSESGPGARDMPDWARDIRDQCCAAGTKLFVEQMARHPLISMIC
jgi:protein gp37